MKKYIILILLLLCSTLMFSQTTGKVKVGNITLRDSLGYLIINAPVKINSPSWISITDLDTSILGDGLKIKNGKLNAIVGRGLNISGDSIVYTGSNTINVDGEKIILQDDGTYSISNYIEFDSLGIGDVELKDNNGKINSDSTSTGVLYSGMILLPTSSNYDTYDLMITSNVNGDAVFRTSVGDYFLFYKTVKVVTGDLILTAGRIQGNKGSDIVADSTIVLGNGNYFNLTTEAGLDFKGIDNTNWQAGSQIILKCNGGIVFKHSMVCYGNVKPFFLTKTTDYITQEDDILTFIYDGTYWREMSRITN